MGLCYPLTNPQVGGSKAFAPSHPDMLGIWIWTELEAMSLDDPESGPL